jgi:hypothetical protein
MKKPSQRTGTGKRAIGCFRLALAQDPVQHRHSPVSGLNYLPQQICLIGRRATVPIGIAQQGPGAHIDHRERGLDVVNEEADDEVLIHFIYHALNYRLTTIDLKDPRIVEMAIPGLKTTARASC